MSRRRTDQRSRAQPHVRGGRSQPRVRGGRSRTTILALGAIGVALVGLAIGAVSLAVNGTGPAPSPAAGSAGAGTAVVDPIGRAIPLLEAQHVPVGTRVTYNSNPPTSGPHWPQPADWGVYQSSGPDELFVHNLEHGGIWLSYRDVDAATQGKLEALAGKYPEAVVLSPRPENASPIAVASWGRVLEQDVLDEQVIVAFITANINKSPEPLAKIGEPALKVGERFADFRVTDVDGRIVTNESLRGKPTIVWFTTTYCVPCQVGARVVARLDDDLGGEAFKVLVLFVDPREQPGDLRQWRTEFAREDWTVALDTDLATRVELRFLDTKYLLDASGMIQDVDVQIADDNYLDRIRKVVEASP